MAKPLRCFAASLFASFLMSVTPFFADARAGTETLSARYEQETNAGNVAGILRRYEQNGAFLSQHNPPSVSRDALAGAYDTVFQTSV